MTPFDPYADRSYRTLHAGKDLIYFRVSAGETDLHIGARRSLEAQALEAALRARSAVKAAIADRPRFATSLEPLRIHGTEVPLVRGMLEAGILASVGPMAAVAGAVAQAVGRELLQYSDEVIVENGGDIFLCGSKQRLIAIHAGQSPLSGLLAVAVTPKDGLGVCTSSGTVGHSLSFGRADAALVVAHDCALADAAATRLGNLVTEPEAIEAALGEICGICGVIGAVAVAGDRIGIQGDIELKTTGGAT